MPRREYDLWANRMRLPELDQEAIKVGPLPMDRFSNSLLIVITETAKV
jgi:hypothetical protein